MLTSATSSSGPPSRTERNAHPELRKLPSTAEESYHRTRRLQYCPETVGQGKLARWLGIIGQALARSGVNAASCPERRARRFRVVASNWSMRSGLQSLDPDPILTPHCEEGWRLHQPANCGKVVSTKVGSGRFDGNNSRAAPGLLARKRRA